MGIDGIRGGLALLCVAALTGCGGAIGPIDLPDLGAASKDVPLDNYTPEQIFSRGEYELREGNAEDAARYFGEVERLYPYSELAQRAVIMQAFAFHEADIYELSRSSAQRYLDFYPASDDAAYATYLVALSYYDQIGEVGRDQKLTFQALQALRDVIEQYPGTEYARSAKLKFDLAYDHLASKEMEIGRYYLKRGNDAAAINRFRVVVEDFQTSTHTAEALHRLVEAYLRIGLTNEAQTAGAILGHNFRGSPYYEESFALLRASGLEPEDKGGSWLSDIYRQVVRGEWL